MKKLVLFVATAIACAAAYGQGTVNFNNRVPGDNIDVPCMYQGARIEGDAFVAQLWAAAPGGTLAPVGPAIPFRTGAGAGYLLTTASDANPDGALRTIPGVAAGGTAEVVIRVWATSLGSSWEEVVAAGLGGYGESATLSIETGGGLNPPANLIGLTSFDILPIVPEPTIAALGILGAGLLLIRRKK
jgi:hypothetical protein